MNQENLFFIYWKNIKFIIRIYTSETFCIFSINLFSNTWNHTELLISIFHNPLFLFYPLLALSHSPPSFLCPLSLLPSSLLSALFPPLLQPFEFPHQTQSHFWNRVLNNLSNSAHRFIFLSLDSMVLCLKSDPSVSEESRSSRKCDRTSTLPWWTFP